MAQRLYIATLTQSGWPTSGVVTLMPQFEGSAGSIRFAILTGQLALIKLLIHTPPLVGSAGPLRFVIITKHDYEMYICTIRGAKLTKRTSRICNALRAIKLRASKRPTCLQCLLLANSCTTPIYKSIRPSNPTSRNHAHGLYTMNR